MLEGNETEISDVKQLNNTNESINKKQINV